MRINIIERTHDTLKFVLRDTNPAFANSLRRTMISWCPTMAIEECLILDNTSGMHDEFLAHRLGLVPLKADIEEFEFKKSCDQCEGKGCSVCTATLSLEVETNEENRMVYSGDLKSTVGGVEPVVPDIPLVKLGPNQKIALEAVAILGYGKEHARWQPVATVGFQYLPLIELDLKKVTEETRDAAQKCHRNVFHIQRGAFEIRNSLDCTLCMECVEADPSGAISVKGDRSQIVFTVESTGALPPARILRDAALILKERAELFIEGLEELEVPSEVSR